MSPALSGASWRRFPFFDEQRADPPSLIIDSSRRLNVDYYKAGNIFSANITRLKVASRDLGQSL
jgi:hypothetical protein